MDTNRPDTLPKARTSQLIIKELPDETLIYDQEHDRAHCLNNTAAVVWRECNGENSIAKITASLQNHVGEPVREELVWLALDQLEEFKLLDRAPANPMKNVSRRAVIRALGLTAVAAPLVASIIVPMAVHAQSTITPAGCLALNPSACPTTLACIGLPGQTCKKVTGSCVCAP